MRMEEKVVKAFEELKEMAKELNVEIEGELFIKTLPREQFIKECENRAMGMAKYLVRKVPPWAFYEEKTLYLRDDLEFFKILVDVAKAIGKRYVEISNEYVKNTLEKEIAPFASVEERIKLKMEKDLAEEFANGFGGWLALKLLPGYAGRHPENKPEINYFLQECLKPDGRYCLHWQNAFLQLEKELSDEMKVVKCVKEAKQNNIKKILNVGG